MEYIITTNGELYHYGVKGMRWGHRKANYQAERDAYRSAKKDLRKTVKESRRSVGMGMGVKGIARAEAANRRINQASVNVINAKAKYKAAKSKNSEKAEFKAYRKEMQKSGLAGSAADVQSGGRSTALYNSLKATKGKEYADKVQKKVQNVAYAQIAAAATVTIGAAFANALINN